MTSADVEQWFQTHQEGPFEFRVGSQKHKRDFKGKRSMCLTLDVFTGLTVMQIQNVLIVLLCLDAKATRAHFMEYKQLVLVQEEGQRSKI